MGVRGSDLTAGTAGCRKGQPDMEATSQLHQPMSTSTPDQSISVLIAVAVRVYRDGLATMLGSHARLRVAGTAATSLEARAAASGLQPDVVLVDVGLEGVFDLMRAMRADSPRTRIVAFAVREEVTAILEYAEAGAEGFITANCSSVELIEAICRTAAGELLCSPRIAAALLRCAAQHPTEPAPQQLASCFTRREQQVFLLLKQGRSNKEIATALYIAEATVKNHVHNILAKLQVATRSQAVATRVPWLEAQPGIP
jgi:two-component system, NarL family, nitrate/nitrite response regulator NarL